MECRNVFQYYVFDGCHLDEPSLRVHIVYVHTLPVNLESRML